MRTIGVGLIGLGTVGSGVVEIFRRHREDFSRRAGVDLDKGDTYTDWARRPLSNTQIEYAFNDVRYLPEVYRRLEMASEYANRCKPGRSAVIKDFDCDKPYNMLGAIKG